MEYHIVYIGKTKHSAWETNSGAKNQKRVLIDYGYDNVTIKHEEGDYFDGQYFV